LATNSANRVSRGLVADVSVEDLYFVTDPEGASIVDLVRKDVKDTDELSSEASSSEQVTLPAKGIIFSPPTTQIFANTHVYEKRLRLQRYQRQVPTLYKTSLRSTWSNWNNLVLYHLLIYLNERCGVSEKSRPLIQPGQLGIIFLPLKSRQVCSALTVSLFLLSD